MKPWIKLWKNDLLSSLNYQALSISQKGIYHQLLLLCRDDEYAGQFCWPNGNPLTLNDIIHAMGPKRGDRADRIRRAIDEMVDRNLLFYTEKGCLEIRNYSQKTKTKSCLNGDQMVSKSCLNGDYLPPKTLKKQGGYKPLYSDTDTDTYTDKKTFDQKPTKDTSQIQELFDQFWLIYPKKVAKQKTLIKWMSLSKKYGQEFISVTVPLMFNTLEKQKLSKQWMQNDGEFIPHLTTWLNQERWNDEVKEKEDWRDG